MKTAFSGGLPGRAKCVAALLVLAVFLCLPSPGVAQPPVMRVTFDGNEIGKPPSGWVCRNGSAAEVYSVQSEEGKKFLRADARGKGVQIGREMAWSLKEFPILEWQWRAVLFPKNGDERKKATDDSVLGIYVVFGQWPLLKVIKYVWSEVLPAGTCLESPFSSRTKMIVLESGRGLEGQWVAERRDVLADFRRLFGGGEAPTARGVAMLTDADNTKSHAIGDYGDMEIVGAAQH
jgi:hypothetical protein